MSQEQFDKRFDQLIRKAAEQHHTTFSEEAWQKMEQLIEKDKRRKKFILRWWSLSLLLIIACGTYIVFTSKSSNEVTSINETLATSKKPASNKSDRHHPSADTIALTSFSKKQQDRPLIKPDLVNQHRASSNFLNEPVEKATKISDPVKIAMTLMTRSHHQLLRGNTIDVHPAEQAVIKNKHSTPSFENSTNADKNGNETKDIDKTLVDKEIEKRINDMEGNDKPVVIVANDTGRTAIPLAKSEVFSTTHTDTNGLAIAKAPIKSRISSQQTKNKLKLDLSLLLSGDITTAEFKRVSNLSGTIGFGIAYNFTSRLGIASGFSVSNKIYKADSTNYKARYSPGPHYYLKNINATCLVFDVPLNVVYKFNEGHKGSWYAIAGLSTYFMNQEKYDYQYIYYNQTKNYLYTLHNRNQHWFSIMNLSVAYRRKTNNHIEWQLAPFAKIPLTGIGEGKVKLYSVGLQFSVHLHSAGK